MRNWIKLYTEVVDDPKMGRLSDRQFRTAINLFALAGLTDEDGQIGSLEDLAWRLRVNADTLADDLQALERHNIIQQDEDGIWTVTKFAERQQKAPSDSRDAVRQRVQEYRQRKGNEQVTPLPPECNEPREEKNREEKNREEKNREEESNAALPSPTKKENPQSKKSKADERTSHPAIQALKTVTGRNPPKGAEPILIKKLGDDPDIPLLTDCYAEWAMRGYKVTNLNGILDWYTKGGPPAINGGNGSRNARHQEYPGPKRDANRANLYPGARDIESVV